MKKGGHPRAGFDYWLGFDGQGVYIDPPLNDNGREIQAKGYMTDLLTQYAVDWLSKPHKKPFMLYLSHKAVHMTFTSAERHRNLYLDAQAHELPTWQDTLAGKPEWQRAAWVWGNLREPWLQNRHQPVPAELPPESWEMELNGQRLEYYQTLSAVDDGVGEILRALEETGQMEETILIFSSDNGFRVPGEKRILSDKRTAHEESIRIPLLVRFPRLTSPGAVNREMVLNIDVLPTLVDLAGADIPRHIQGRSFVPLLTGKSVPWRDSFLYEYFMEDWVPGIPSVYAVRTKEWKYMMYPDIKAGLEPYETLQDMDELYNLSKDPHELKNLADNPEYSSQLNRMKAEIHLQLNNIQN
jgi:N-acetylglucosamine-6-sulfatase